MLAGDARPARRGRRAGRRRGRGARARRGRARARSREPWCSRAATARVPSTCSSTRAGSAIVEIDGERHRDGAAHGSGCTHSSLRGGPACARASAARGGPDRPRADGRGDRERAARHRPRRRSGRRAGPRRRSCPLSSSRRRCIPSLSALTRRHTAPGPQSGPIHSREYIPSLYGVEKGTHHTPAAPPLDARRSSLSTTKLAAASAPGFSYPDGRI